MSIETRVAVISIIVGNEDAAQKINEILHEYRGYIIGRMGIPYRSKGILRRRSARFPARSESCPGSAPRRLIPM